MSEIESAPLSPTATEADVPWLSDDEQRAWRAYLRGSRALEAVLDAELQDAGMSLAEYELLSMLSEAPGQEMRMSRLADQTVQSRSRVTHTATRLTRRGWVERRPAPDDGRGIQLKLNDAGLAAVRSASRVHATGVQEHLIRQMDPALFQSLGDAMRNVRNHLLGAETDNYNP
ncbi:MAG TPA: MarR family transcriptional regulator [Flexivirga sp.]|uniref:MarR family winged helix-turn-helix transcriptional regulator n=1 Tax=Flexivirga sp. TaxID=1962927 RepID=UPI002C9AFE04|nr:MarR family transcriptional regulator [Flexivirga sp.]HWC22354.1 MarR family transcriptional regulator [Flexivirga sp.]